MLRKLSWPLLLITIGFGGGLFMSLIYLNTKAGAENDCLKKYSLTSNTVDCAEYEESLARLSALDEAFNEATTKYVAEGKAKRVSVWVRDLETRQWAASNEFETYSPSSLLKLPLVIAYYKFSELDPTILTDTIIYQPQANPADSVLYFTKPTTLVPGETYTIEDLIERSMIHSDNAAAIALYMNVDPAFYEKTLIELGIQIPTSQDLLNYVTVKTYANIFRMLYNTSYLNRDLSQKILDLMTRSSFAGIADPLPESVTIAHKFGERSVSDGSGQITKRQLLDCGIVYKGGGEHPYSLCVMAEGDDFEALLSIIKELSKITYDHM